MFDMILFDNDLLFGLSLNQRMDGAINGFLITEQRSIIPLAAALYARLKSFGFGQNSKYLPPKRCRVDVRWRR